MRPIPQTIFFGEENHMRTHRLGLFLAFVLAFLGSAVAQTATAPGAADAKRKQIVQQGHDAYYSLHAHGLDGFQSTIKPNWEQVLKTQGVTDPAQLDSALKLLNGIHFTMVMDDKGKVTVAHKTDVEPPNEMARKGFEDIYNGIDQAVSGFFATWSLFMLTSPFPEVDSLYQVDEQGSQYRLSYKDGSSDVVTLLGKDMAIQEVKVTSPQFTSVVRPHITKTATGFVLAGYDADYTPTNGPGVVHLDVKISHEVIQGLQLPVSLIADSTLDGTPTHMELAFSEYQVKSH
jgi:hypothetical protein